MNRIIDGEPYICKSRQGDRHEMFDRVVYVFSTNDEIAASIQQHDKIDDVMVNVSCGDWNFIAYLDELHPYNSKESAALTRGEYAQDGEPW